MFKNLLLALLLFPALAFAQITPSPNNVNGGLNAAPSNLTAPVKLGTPKIADTGVLLQATSDPGNTYNQFIIQNTDAGNTASANFVVNNNLGTATTYYGEFGMDSSTFAGSGSFALPSAVYLDSKNGDLALGTLTSNAIHFVVNNGATDAMTITSAGVVNIVGASTGLQLGGINGISLPSSDSTAGASISIGSSALSGQTVSAAYQNTAIGYQSMAGVMTTAAVQNTAVGYIALNALTSGTLNTSVGRSSGLTLTSGGGNTFVGQNAGRSVTIASNNTIVGIGAGFSPNGPIGGANTILGAFVASTTLGSGSGNILIGTNVGVDVQTAAASNTLNIGNLIYGTNLSTSGTAPQGSAAIGTSAPATNTVLTLGGHLGFYQAAVPVVSACGGGTAAASSTDNKGQITGITAATACTITFGSTMPTAPACSFSTSTGIAVGISAISTAAVTTSMAALTGSLYYICQ